MKITLITFITRRIPRRWWLLLSVVICFYILFKFLVTNKSSVTSRSYHKSNPSLQRTLNHAVGPNEEVRLLANISHINHVLDNKVLAKEDILAENVNDKLEAQEIDQKESGVQENGSEQLILDPPEEMDIPHLYFNDEGQGQMGMSVRIDRRKLNERDKKLYDQGYERNNFNEYASNLISVDRKLPEIRDPRCLQEIYPPDLPDTSVIMCFLNEAWSVLVRSVHSIINTSPPHLLREIILVDDYSDYDHLKAPLDKYMQKFPKVKIVRNTEREGLIRSRLNGAKVATGQVLTFLDSHIECTTGWLPPLLARIKENSSHVVWPVIPVIDRNTFKLGKFSSDKIYTGIFTWHMTFQWELPNVKDRETVISPIKSPTMAGGLFSIDREYFYHSGSYDEEMRFWGGENLEMSFRIWMCGGTIEIIPCSVIGHIFREKNVNIDDSNRDAMRVNTIRTVMVWLDQYKYLYAKVASKTLNNYGDISGRIKLREKLKCHNFDWYLNNVYKSVFNPLKSVMSGLIRSVHDSSTCLQATDNINESVRTNHCSEKDFRRQQFYVTDQEEIRLLYNCMDAGSTMPKLQSCHKGGNNQQILYRQDKTIFHPGSYSCLQWLDHSADVKFLPCDGTSRQKWTWQNVSLNLH